MMPYMKEPNDTFIYLILMIITGIPAILLLYRMFTRT